MILLVSIVLILNSRVTCKRSPSMSNKEKHSHINGERLQSLNFTVTVSQILFFHCHGNVPQPGGATAAKPFAV